MADQHNVLKWRSWVLGMDIAFKVNGSEYVLVIDVRTWFAPALTISYTSTEPTPVPVVSAGLLLNLLSYIDYR